MIPVDRCARDWVVSLFHGVAKAGRVRKKEPNYEAWSLQPEVILRS